MHLPYFFFQKNKNYWNQQETATWYFAWLTGEELISPISRDGNTGNEKYNTKKPKHTVTEILHLNMLSDVLLRFWQSIMKNHLLRDLAAHFLCPAWQAHLLLEQFANFNWVTGTHSHSLQNPNRPTLLLHQTQGKMQVWENNNCCSNIKVFPIVVVLHISKLNLFLFPFLN